MQFYSKSSPLAEIMPGIKKASNAIGNAYNNQANKRVNTYGGGDIQALNGQPLPPGNAQALNGQGQIAPPVNLAQTATQQPGYVSPAQVGGMRRASEIMAGKNTVGAPIPQGVNAGPQLPGQGQNDFDNDYMQRNYGDLNNRQVNQERFQRNNNGATTQEQAVAQG